MTDILKAILANSAALAVFLVATSLLVIAAVAIYVIAFAQGRSISFWPPSIGVKPAQQSPPPEPSVDGMELNSQQSISSIRAGTRIVTSSRKWVRIESDSYTGVRATLMKATNAAEKAVMVKLFWRGLNPSSDAWADFSREYKAIEGLHHRNIIEMSDRGIWKSYPFLVFEYFPGGTLYDLIKTRARITGPEILSIAEQVASGIDYAHSAGWIHQDITPSNILFESDTGGRIAISDFGIARILGGFDNTHETHAGTVFEGTPAYVAPEVFQAEPVTASVDIYGFGVVLFEMITGKCPFPEVKTLYALLRLKLLEPVPRLLSFRKVPSDLDQRLFDTLSLDPKDRPQTARAVLSGVESSLLNL
jgi:serine/threonine protein kinase